MRCSAAYTGLAGLFYLSDVLATPINRPSVAIQLCASKVYSANSTSTATNSHSTGAKIAETILAVVSVIVVVTTYQVLISTSRRLSSTSKLPMRCIKGNVKTILESAWPDNSLSTQTLAPQTEETNNNSSDAIRLLYCGEMDGDADKGRVGRGIQQCKAESGRLTTPPLWLTNGSSSTSSMVSLVIWEWVSMWMVLYLLISTLFQNGFIAGPRGTDAFLRLSIVLTFVVAFIGHLLFVLHSCVVWFTSVAAGASWSFLARARFGVIDGADYEHRLSTPGEKGPLPFRELSSGSKDFLQETFEANLAHEAYPDDAEVLPNHAAVGHNSDASTVPRPSRKANENAIRGVEQMRKNEISTVVTSASTALERIVANGMAIASVTVATGYLVWSTDQNDQNSQLGSLGVLAALAVGAAAMFSSTIQLQTVNTSFEQLVLIKEILINGQAEEFATKKKPFRQPISFMRNSMTVCMVRMSDFVKINNVWDVVCFLLFGPGWFLLPSKEDQNINSRGSEYEVEIIVRGQKVRFTTAGTDQHSKGEGGQNVNAVNVCFVE